MGDVTHRKNKHIVNVKGVLCVQGDTNKPHLDNVPAVFCRIEGFATKCSIITFVGDKGYTIFPFSITKNAVKTTMNGVLKSLLTSINKVKILQFCTIMLI